MVQKMHAVHAAVITKHKVNEEFSLLLMIIFHCPNYLALLHGMLANFLMPPSQGGHYGGLSLTAAAMVYCIFAIYEHVCCFMCDGCWVGDYFHIWEKLSAEGNSCCIVARGSVDGMT